MRSRGERRYQRERLKKKRKWYWGGPAESYPQPNCIIFCMTEAYRLSKLARTPHPCSRFCCANRRRFEGPRVNEIRRTPHEEDWQDDQKHVAAGSVTWSDVCPDLFWEKYDYDD